MHSPLERGMRVPALKALRALLLATVLCSPVCALAADEYPTDAQVSAALESLKQDPNLASTRKIKVLRYAGRPKVSAAGDEDTPAWMQPFTRFFEWLAEAVRQVVWVACVLLVGIMVVYLLRVLRKRGQKSAATRVDVPTHVQELDIRPESLPDDIGATSRALWERGEHRSALAMLYRGCLSRLVHVYGAPVHDSTTEGECIGLATSHLTPANAAYVSRLVRIWERSVYRGEAASADVVLTLCDSFGGALDPPLPPAGVAGRPA